MIASFSSSKKFVKNIATVIFFGVSDVSIGTELVRMVQGLQVQTTMQPHFSEECGVAEGECHKSVAEGQGREHGEKAMMMGVNMKVARVGARDLDFFDTDAYR